MPLRPPAGFIRPGYDPLKVPDAPTGASATGGDASASVSFTPPSDVGGSAVSAYYAVSNPGQITGTAASSPVSVTGLTNGTPYTFTVWALNTYGPSPYSAASGSVTPALQRGIFAGGEAAAVTNVIQYISISTLGNALDFGDLTVNSYNGSGCASSTRGIVAGGQNINVIQYITIASAGNSIDFGDLNEKKGALAGCSNATRGLFAGGGDLSVSLAGTEGIYYITIASTGNAVYFGDMSAAMIWRAACASTTRAIYGGGYSDGSVYSTIDYSTIATTGNTTNFGNLNGSNFNFTAGCSGTRGIFGGGEISLQSNVIQYVTMATTGNATDFGDLTIGRNSLASAASSTRVVFGGGFGGGAKYNVMDYITSATTGNATDFGDLLAATRYPTGFSNAHGGLQ